MKETIDNENEINAITIQRQQHLLISTIFPVFFFISEIKAKLGQNIMKK